MTSAPNNSKIMLNSGNYSMDANTVYINKNLAITSNNKDNVVIKARSANTDVFTINKGYKLSITNVRFMNMNRQSLFANKGKLTISNVDFINNRVIGTSTNKKALVNNYGSLAINKCNFTRSYGYNGSVLYNVANATVYNSNLRNGNALFGGAIYSHYNNVTIKNCNITGNTVNASTTKNVNKESYVYTGGMGGAIYNRATMNIYNSNLQANKIPNGPEEEQIGGAIFNNGNLKISNTKVIYNYISGSGAAIFNNKTLTVTASYINNNEASNISGGIVNTKQATISKTTLNKNIAEIGAAIYNLDQFKLLDSIVNSNEGTDSVISNENNLYIKNLTMMKNSAFEGGVLSNFNKLTMHTSKITQNMALWGGAIATYGPTVITSSKINSNEAETGGAIDGWEATITIKNTEINSNYAYVAGGAISTYDTTLTIDNCTIKGNKLATYPDYDIAAQSSDYDSSYDDRYYSYGGALFIKGKTTKILNSNICYNTADCGGAVAIMYGTLLMNVSRISNNTARYVGGAISTYYGFTEDAPLIKLTKVNMTYNYAADGGHAIFSGEWELYGGRVFIDKSNINNNGRSTTYSDYNYVFINENIFKITNSNIKNNKGSLSYATASMRVDNCQITGNVVNNGNLIESYTNLNITNTKIRGNTAKYVIYTHEGQGYGKLSISKSTLYNTKAKYEIYNSHSSSSISNVKCDNNWWGTTSKPTNRVYNCKINSYNKGLN